MPMLILHAAIAFVSVIIPHRHRAFWVQRVLTEIAATRANARWVATIASVQDDLPVHTKSFGDELVDTMGLAKHCR